MRKMQTTSSDLLLAQITERAEIKILLEALGPEADLHLVGGSVRDAVRGVKSIDLDLATRLKPEQIISALDARQIGVYPTGLKHQTVTARPVENGENVEITTFRGAGMRPELGLLSSESIEEDLAYRDFTINALAFSLNTKQLIDPFSGRRDITEGILRAVGDAEERFKEDPLRTLRMLRFAAKFGFQIEEHTVEAAKNLRHLLSKVSPERIRDELSKTLLTDRPAWGFRLLRDLGMLELLLPEIFIFCGFEQNDFHLEDLFDHTMTVVSRTPPDLLLRMSALLHDIGKPISLSINPETGRRHFFRHESLGVPIAKKLLERLRYPSAFIQDVCILIETHMRPIEAGPPGLRRILRDTGELFPAWRVLKEADAGSCKIDVADLAKRLGSFDEAIAELRKGPPLPPLKHLALNGHDMLALGYEGPMIGKMLRGLYEKVLDDPRVNERETLLGLLKQVEKEISDTVVTN